MRILLTGAAGFIGSHLCDRLLLEGHEVVGMDNFITGRSENLAHLAGHPNFSFIRHDVSNFIFVPGKLDAVMHFASPASPNPRSEYSYINLPIATMKAGALGTHNTFGVALANDARYLLASTSEVYGDPLEHPQHESYYGHVDSVGIRSVYDEAKRFAEALTMAYHRFHQMDTRIARIFNTYGPRMLTDDGRVVPNFITQALNNEPLTIYGDGEQTRSFCYIDDLVEGVYRLLMFDGKTYVDEHFLVNLGSPVETSISGLAKLVNQLAGNKTGLQYKPDMRGEGDPQRRCPVILRAETFLGWMPKTSLEEGLLKTIEYFKEELNA